MTDIETPKPRKKGVTVQAREPAPAPEPKQKPKPKRKKVQKAKPAPKAKKAPARKKVAKKVTKKTTKKVAKTAAKTKKAPARKKASKRGGKKGPRTPTRQYKALTRHKSWDYDFTEPEVIDAFGANLAEARIAAGMTQQQLADTINYTRIAVCNMERGKNGGTLPTVLRICSVLKVTPNDLLRKR